MRGMMSRQTSLDHPLCYIYVCDFGVIAICLMDINAGKGWLSSVDAMAPPPPTRLWLILAREYEMFLHTC